MKSDDRRAQAMRVRLDGLIDRSILALDNARRLKCSAAGTLFDSRGQRRISRSPAALQAAGSSRGT
jgi:hypothetical protein